MNKKYLNKKKINLLNYKLFIIIIILLVSLFFFFKYENITNLSINYIENFSEKYNYNLKIIKINNLKNLDKNELLVYVNKYKEKSIFLIPLKEIVNNINKLNWIKNVKITSNYKDTLYFYLEEEEPAGVYVNNNQNILFSKSLVILEIIKNENKYINLVKFYGKNSLYNSNDILFLLDTNYLSNIESATYIGNRRWDIKFKNSLILKLPEYDIKKALENYKKMYANLSNKELKDIETIDLRINNQAIIKYK